MTVPFTRRGAVLGGLALSACVQAGVTGSGAKNVPPPDYEPLVEIEQRIGGRLGVFALRLGPNMLGLPHRADQAFPMCSTFKWLLAAMQLRMAERGERSLDEALAFDESDLLDYAPVAREHLAHGSMTIEQACEAAVKMSDNTAANLLLETQGGPAGFTRAVQEFNPAIRLDRNEPGLNDVAPGDLRDTTTPAAMVHLLEALLLRENSFIHATRDRLITWMVESPTGRSRLRAGFPRDWRVADKTGTWNGQYNATNDVAIAWPPNGAPIVIACYMHCSTVEPEVRNAAHAEIARIITERLG